MKNNKFRTDLALEAANTGDKKLPKGVFVEEKKVGNLTLTVVEIKTEAASLRLNRKKGRYVTIEGDFFYKDEFVDLLEAEVKKLLPRGRILVSGFGNINITPDSIGPLTAQRIIATSHLSQSFKEDFSLEGLRDVSVVFPGATGQTGIETGQQIKSLIDKFSFDGLLTIDALAALSSKRLGTTVQICSCGISPGSGVGNTRAEISRDTMGIPVISIGVPTVTDAFTILSEAGKREEVSCKANMILTPKDIDSIVKKSVEVLSEALNYALQENIEKSSIRLLS